MFIMLYNVIYLLCCCNNYSPTWDEIWAKRSQHRDQSYFTRTLALYRKAKDDLMSSGSNMIITCDVFIYLFIFHCLSDLEASAAHWTDWWVFYCIAAQCLPQQNTCVNEDLPIPCCQMPVSMCVCVCASTKGTVMQKTAQQSSFPDPRFKPIVPRDLIG